MNHPLYSTAEKWCSNCSQHRKPEGGRDIIFNKGLNKRWLCGWCCKRRDERRAG